jgi:uncharacterized Zn-binding protein involved in type VI secretion
MSGSYLPARTLYRYKSDIMPPAARITDMHVCPMFTGPVPHVGGPILPPCSVNVMIGYLPAARVGDMATCAGPPDVIIKGSPTVFINGRPAARMLDTTAHGGTIVMGCFTVIIGDGGGGAGGGGMGGGGGGLAQGTSASVAAEATPTSSPESAKYGTAITIEGDAAYQAKVQKDLDAIAATPSGKKMLADLEASGKKVTIKPTQNPDDGNAIGYTNVANATRKADGSANIGSDSTITYNPDREVIGSEPWATRPPAIGLGHEIVHATHAAHGERSVTQVQNDHVADATSATGYEMAKEEEVRTVGIPPYDKEPYSENTLRSEWTPPQPARPNY